MKLRMMLVAVLLLSGCTSAGQLKSNAGNPSENESVFVIGVTPENYRISVWPGGIKDDHFYKSSLRNAALYSAAEGGYVVGRAKAGDVLGITNARIVSGENSILGLDYVPCGDTLVFKVPPGQVIYLGSIAFSSNGKTVNALVSNDVNAAAHHMADAFPSITRTIVKTPFMHLPSTGCSSSTKGDIQ